VLLDIKEPMSQRAVWTFEGGSPEFLFGLQGRGCSKYALNGVNKAGKPAVFTLFDQAPLTHCIDFHRELNVLIALTVTGQEEAWVGLFDANTQERVSDFPVR
jgi:hypothetical protein